MGLHVRQDHVPYADACKNARFFPRGRLTNSTQGVFEDRIAALEGGTAGLAVASGAAAVEYAVRNITQSGDHIVAAKNIYGGTFNLLRHTLPRDGITTTFVSAENPQEFEDAIQENTIHSYCSQSFSH